MAELVDVAVGVVVLDRASDRTGLGDARDRERSTLRIGAVAVLEVDRERQLCRPVELRNVLDDLLQLRGAVDTSEREGEA